MCLVPRIQLVALWRMHFSYLRNTMQFRSPLAQLWFETWPKWLRHLKELSEYILLPDFSLTISNNFVSLSFFFTLFEKSENRFHKEDCGDDNVLNFILRSLKIEFDFHNNSYSFCLCTFCLKYSPTSILLLEKSPFRSMEKEYFWGQNIKIIPQTQWFGYCSIFSNVVKKNVSVDNPRKKIAKSLISSYLTTHTQMR